MIHRNLLYNGQVRDSSERFLTPGQVGLLNGWGVFSTIRVIDGLLFAFERHWARMKRDAELLRVPFPSSAEELHEQLLSLVAANGVEQATLRVAIIRNKGGMWEGPGIARPYDIVAFTADINDWGRSVKLGVVPEARHAASRFAGTKMLSWSLNLTWYEEAHERGYDEVVLLNERGEVSECTSANIFAATGGKVLTPPLSSGCLPGITREILLDEVKVDGITVVEQPLTLPDLEAADEIFITSTTRELLAVAEIEGLQIQSKDFTRPRLQAAFGAFVDDYVAKRKVSLAT